VARDRGAGSDPAYSECSGQIRECGDALLAGCTLRSLCVIAPSVGSPSLLAAAVVGARRDRLVAAGQRGLGPLELQRRARGVPGADGGEYTCRQCGIGGLPAHLPPAVKAARANLLWFRRTSRTRRSIWRARAWTYEGCVRQIAYVTPNERRLARQGGSCCSEVPCSPGEMKSWRGDVRSTGIGQSSGGEPQRRGSEGSTFALLAPYVSQ
jgi:hypothetical protein